MISTPEAYSGKIGDKMNAPFGISLIYWIIADIILAVADIWLFVEIAKRNKNIFYLLLLLLLAFAWVFTLIMSLVATSAAPVALIPPY